MGWCVTNTKLCPRFQTVLHSESTAMNYSVVATTADHLLLKGERYRTPKPVDEPDR